MMDERSQSVGSPTSFHQVLILLFGALFFSPGGGEPLAERVKDAVPTAPGRSVRSAPPRPLMLLWARTSTPSSSGTRSSTGPSAGRMLMRPWSGGRSMRSSIVLRSSSRNSSACAVNCATNSSLPSGPRSSTERATLRGQALGRRGSHRGAARDAAVRRPRSGSAYGPWPAPVNPRAWPGRSATARPPEGPRRRGRRARCWSPR